MTARLAVIRRPPAISIPVARPPSRRMRVTLAPVSTTPPRAVIAATSAFTMVSAPPLPITMPNA